MNQTTALLKDVIRSARYFLFQKHTNDGLRNVARRLGQGSCARAILKDALPSTLIQFILNCMKHARVMIRVVSTEVVAVCLYCALAHILICGGVCIMLAGRILVEKNTGKTGFGLFCRFFLDHSTSNNMRGERDGINQEADEHCSSIVE